MTNLTIKTFAAVVTETTFFRTGVSPVFMVAEFTNNTKTPIVISNIIISIKCDFLWFSKEFDCNISKFALLGTERIDINLSNISKNYSDNKKFTIIVKDSNGNEYESSLISISLFK